MNHKLNIQTAKGAMQIILNKAQIDAARSLGCTEKEWTLLVGPIPWKANDRNIVKRLLDQVIYGMMDTMALPRFKVPAEYIAAVITAMVTPCNYFPACSWLENTYKAEDLGNFDGSQLNSGEMEKVSNSRLFALVCALKSDEEIDAIVKQFSRKCDIALGFVQGEEINET